MFCDGVCGRRRLDDAHSCRCVFRATGHVSDTKVTLLDNSNQGFIIITCSVVVDLLQVLCSLCRPGVTVFTQAQDCIPVLETNLYLTIEFLTQIFIVFH